MTTETREKIAKVQRATTRKKLSKDQHPDCRTGCKASHPLQCARGNACQRK